MPKNAQSTNESGLSIRQEKALAALLACPSVADAAKQTGISAAVIYRWLNTHTIFQTAYTNARKSYLQNIIAGLQSAATASVETLHTIQGDASIAASVRVSAARTLLEMTFRAADAFDFDSRLREIETKLQSGGAV